MTTTEHTPTIRRSDDRGVTDLGWLLSRHAFSFGDYRDPAHMGYRVLRVLNDDVVAPGGGFPSHPHRDMEILTWVLSGALRHQDSTGGGGVLRPGELQAMTAGTGIVHSEMNDSDDEPVHFLQIWIEPERAGLPPAYAQRAFDAAGRRDRWQLLASGGDTEDALQLHQDVQLRVADLGPGRSVALSAASGRYGYLQVAEGAVVAGGQALGGGDALHVTGPADIAIEAAEPSQLLWFDLP